jgi:hypothetical protein
VKCLFSQIGLSFDFVGMAVFLGSLVIWIIGLVPGLIGFVLNRRSTKPTPSTLCLGAITLLSAMILWAICIWRYAKWGLDDSAGHLVTMLALVNTCVVLGSLFLPAHK